jgi:hypothetical protein
MGGVGGGLIGLSIPEIARFGASFHGVGSTPAAIYAVRRSTWEHTTTVGYF